MRATLNLISSRRKLGSGEPSDLVTQFAGIATKNRFSLPSLSTSTFSFLLFRLFRHRNVRNVLNTESSLARFAIMPSSLTIKSSTFTAVKPENFVFTKAPARVVYLCEEKCAKSHPHQKVDLDATKMYSSNSRKLTVTPRSKDSHLVWRFSPRDKFCRPFKFFTICAIEIFCG